MTKPVFIRLLGAALLCGFLTACGPGTLETTVKTDAELNPNADNNPSPVMVQIFQLKDDARFKKADYTVLIDEPEKTLGNDLLKSYQHYFNPGEEQKLPEIVLLEQTRFIGIVSAYRNIDNAQWRTIHPVNEGSSYRLELNLGRLTLKSTLD